MTEGSGGAVTWGPNMKRLWAQFVSVASIPEGGTIEDGFRFFADSDHRQQVLDEANAGLRAAIVAVKAAPDNPYHTDEEIAGALLRRLEESK